ncbi:MAG TPA: polysaccharide deacetylase family protein [Longimicrobiaceae bacterium]|nr:polysaccharide deacetylase family protein [Longimicrobiaceae bacterium]
MGAALRGRGVAPRTEGRVWQMLRGRHRRRSGSGAGAGCPRGARGWNAGCLWRGRSSFQQSAGAASLAVPRPLPRRNAQGIPGARRRIATSPSTNGCAYHPEALHRAGPLPKRAGGAGAALPPLRHPGARVPQRRPGGRLGRGRPEPAPPAARVRAAAGPGAAHPRRGPPRAARLPGRGPAAHTWSHPNLAALGPEELEEEMVRPLRWLRERFTGVLPWLTYPYGLTSPAVEEAARRAGYEGAFRVEGGWMPRGGAGARPHALPRANVPAGASLEHFEMRTSGLLPG